MRPGCGTACRVIPKRSGTRLYHAYLCRRRAVPENRTQCLPHLPAAGGLAHLSEAGVYAGIWLNPVLPYLTDDWENLESLLVRTREAGRPGMPSVSLA